MKDLPTDQNKQLSPRDILKSKAEKWQLNMASEEFARKLDQNDLLRHFREEFYYPTNDSHVQDEKSHANANNECIYLCGHSLGLQPKRVRKWIDVWLNDWAKLGVRGHFEGSNPFSDCDNRCIPTLNSLVGAQNGEVAISFYRPTSDRFKILYEERCFPSDEYAIESHLKLHQVDSTAGKVILRARQNETYIRTEDVIELLKEHGDSIALLLLGGIQFYTGQLFDIETITRVAQQYGCVVGWDLAHVVGNVPVKLHDWNVDFAVWCSYKYLNGGSGGVGGIFIHSKHFDNEYPSLNGWWGNRKETKFLMKPNIDRDCGAKGFRVSTPSIHQCATLAASLEVKSSSNIKIQILTPDDPEQRGAQLSLRIINVNAREVFDELTRLGVVLDIRNDVIRVAPTPLYNSFMDVYRFVSLFKTIQFTSSQTKQ
ncbi:unnamed protein product [Adineta steineri]|uniref:Kynureninase n=1 Tax=Adineta steineri TaxID=433720 RepID=A0A813Z087_9BILA|nr:unnamed protein product [Adineta steineri]